MDKVNYRTTKSELVAVPLPEQTATYKPITHEQLINLTLETLDKVGLIVEKEWYDSARGGQIATGHYAIKNIADNEMQLRIAWQNSYNKMVSLKFALGGHVFVCSNGAVSGDMGAFRRKHTGDVQEFTPKTIEEYILTAADTFRELQRQRDLMKELQLSKRLQAEIIGRMFIEEGFIESTQMNIIKRELIKPSFDYGAPNSMWELYQFTTFAMKEIHPSDWMRNHLAANTFFVRESGVIVPEKKILVASTGEEQLPGQMEIYDVPGVTEAPPDVRLYPLTPEECFKLPDKVVPPPTTEYQDLM